MLYRLHTLSESTQKLPSDIKEQYEGVNWRRLAIMRNALVHDYLGNIPIERVYPFIEKELPPLQKAMEQQLPEWRTLKSRFKDGKDIED